MFRQDLRDLQDWGTSILSILLILSKNVFMAEMPIDVWDRENRGSELNREIGEISNHSVKHAMPGEVISLGSPA